MLFVWDNLEDEANTGNLLLDSFESRQSNLDFEAQSKSTDKEILPCSSIELEK